MTLDLYDLPKPGPSPPSPPGRCSGNEYCCPDAKRCLLPTEKSCAKDANACGKGEVCCPLTKICVVPRAPCESPCANDSYCCPVTKTCATPTKPGVFCRGSGSEACAKGETCCPTTRMCVKLGPTCTPPLAMPAFVKKTESCNEDCRTICCRDGGGDACVTACGCPAGSCPHKNIKKMNADFEKAMLNRWNSNEKAVNGGCQKPGACGIAYQGCCFGAGHSGDACKCKLVDGSGEVGTDCSGTDKAGACGVAYTACCIGYKAKGNPCTCDVESGN